MYREKKKHSYARRPKWTTRRRKSSPSSTVATNGQRTNLPSITVYHTSSPSRSTRSVSATSTSTPSVSENNNLNFAQKSLIRDVYRQCLAHAATSGKYMTSPQRQSLQTAIMTEVALQPPPGPPVSQPSGSPVYPNPPLTTAELASLLQQSLSTSVSKSPPAIQSQGTNTSA